MGGISAGELTLIIRAKDEVTRTLGKIRGGLQRFGSAARQAFKAAAIGVVAFVAAAAGLVFVGQKLLAMGAELDQIDLKARTVFGPEAIGRVEAWAAANAASFGLTRTQLKGVAASFQDLLIPMGFTRDAATELTTSTIGLAGALSEWSGGQRTAAEVANILAKAMLGEREELKSLGISISEADVKGRLLELGFNKLTGAALQQARAIATQQLIFEKSTDAQEAFKNGGDSLIRAQSELRASMSEVKEAIIRALMPAMRDVARFLQREGVPRLQELSVWIGENLPKALERAREMFAKILPVLQNFAIGVKVIFDFITANRATLIASLTAIGVALAIAFPVVAIVAAIGGIVAAIGWLSRNMDLAGVSILKAIDFIVDGFLKGLAFLTDKIGDFIEGPINALGNIIGKIPGVSGFNVQFGSFGVPSQFTGLDAEIARREGIIANAAAAAAEAKRAKALAESTTIVNASADAAGEAASAIDLASAALLDQAQAAGDSATATAAATDAEKALADARSSIEQSFLEEQIEAFIRGGDARVAIVKAEQAALETEWSKVAEDLRSRFGVEVPDAFFAMFRSITEGAKKTADTVDELMQLRANIVASALGGGVSGAAAAAAVLAGAATNEQINALTAALAAGDEQADVDAANAFIQAGGGTTIVVNQTIEGSLVTESEVAENAVAAVEAALAEGDLELEFVPASEGPGGFSQ